MRLQQYLISIDVLHMDVKPANVLVNTEDCTVKICDLGDLKDTIISSLSSECSKN